MNLLTLEYWVKPLPGPWLESSLKIVYAVYGLLAILGLVAWWFAGKNKQNKVMIKFWQKIQSLTLTMGIAGLFLVFCRQQKIYFLAMPIWHLLLIVGGVVWGRLIFKYYTKIIPKRRAEQQEKERKAKYLV